MKITRGSAALYSAMQTNIFQKLGEKIKLKIKLEEKLNEKCVESTPCVPLPTPPQVPVPLPQLSPMPFSDETLCSICEKSINNYIPEYFLGEEINAACENCNDRTVQTQSFQLSQAARACLKNQSG